MSYRTRIKTIYLIFGQIDVKNHISEQNPKIRPNFFFQNFVFDRKENFFSLQVHTWLMYMIMKIKRIMSKQKRISGYFSDQKLGEKSLIFSKI
jgi:hypothetical protein